jgi:hypothetical protein
MARMRLSLTKVPGMLIESLKVVSDWAKLIRWGSPVHGRRVCRDEAACQRRQVRRNEKTGGDLVADLVSGSIRVGRVTSAAGRSELGRVHRRARRFPGQHSHHLVRGELPDRADRFF